MPLALGIIAALIFVIAIKGNYSQAGALFNQTFFHSGGSSGFLVWAGSIFGIAVIFRLIRAPQAGEAFIGLLILVYFLAHDNVLSQINASLSSVNASTPAATTTATVTASPSPMTPAATGATTPAATGATTGGN